LWHHDGHLDECRALSQKKILSSTPLIDTQGEQGDQGVGQGVVLHFPQHKAQGVPQPRSRASMQRFKAYCTFPYPGDAKPFLPGEGLGGRVLYCTIQTVQYSTKDCGCPFVTRAIPSCLSPRLLSPPASRLPHFASSKYDFGRSASSRDKWRHCYLMATAHLYLAIGRGMRYRRYLFSNGGERGASDCLRSLLRDEY
jgi:hypothetical protein